MGLEEDARFHPDRALSYARWILSRDPSRLDEDEQRIVAFLRGDGQEILKILEDGDRGALADESFRGYYRYLMTVHAVCLRLFGRMLPQRLVEVLYRGFFVLLIALAVAGFWWLRRATR